MLMMYTHCTMIQYNATISSSINIIIIFTYCTQIYFTCTVNLVPRHEYFNKSHYNG